MSSIRISYSLLFPLLAVLAAGSYFSGCGNSAYGKEMTAMKGNKVHYPDGGEVRYRVIENYYGPHIRWRDWEAQEGDIESAGGCLHIYGAPDSKVVRSDYRFGGGGDVEIKIRFNFERLEKEGHAVFHFNKLPGRSEPNGFRLEFSRGNITLHLKGEKVLKASHELVLDKNNDIEIKLATLGLQYAVAVNEEITAAGRMAAPAPRGDNEGWMVIETREADLRIKEFEENFIRHDKPLYEWRRKKLLYEESFTRESLDKNWIVNTSGGASGMEKSGGAFILRHMANAFLREKFHGPVAVEVAAAPQPAPHRTAGISDAILIWMIDMPDGDFLEHLDEHSRKGDASLDVIRSVPCYWIDKGGSNNVTTRLRRNPYRLLVRQFADRPRLLERDTAYHFVCVQIEDAFEFWVDGKPLVRAFDEEPLDKGRVGFRAMREDIIIQEMKVWRIEHSGE